MSTEPIRIWIGLGALLLSVLTLGRCWVADRQARNTALINALQGESKSVIYTALTIASSGWFGTIGCRAKRVRTLCIVWPLEESCHVRATIFSALQELTNGNPGGGIAKVLRSVHGSYRDYQAKSHDPDMQGHLAALETLAANLHIPSPPHWSRSHSASHL